MPDRHGWPTKEEREIDARVAEKVMGLDVERDGVTRDLRIDHVIRGTNLRVLPYTTDLNAAWQVVERITQPPTKRDEPYHSAGPRFAIWFKTADLWASTGAETAEMICKAALKCVGVEREE